MTERADLPVSEHRAIVVAALEELATMGHEEWKTAGHPMDAWVSRDRVNRLAETALASFQAAATDESRGVVTERADLPGAGRVPDLLAALEARIGSEGWLRERFPDKDWHRHRRTDGRTDLCDGTPSDCDSKPRVTPPATDESGAS